jgi:hypothetical protein
LHAKQTVHFFVLENVGHEEEIVQNPCQDQNLVLQFENFRLRIPRRPHKVVYLPKTASPIEISPAIDSGSAMLRVWLPEAEMGGFTWSSE